MNLTESQGLVLNVLAQDGSIRGLTSGEILEASRQLQDNAEDVEFLLQTLIDLSLVEKRDQTAEFWPSGHPAEAIPLAGGQIRSRTRYRIVRRSQQVEEALREYCEGYYNGIDDWTVR